MNLPCTVARREEIELALHDLPANLSARYRAARMALFGRVIQQHSLKGVILAHHADDQAETVLQRLLRGSGPRGLGGIARESTVQGVTILRPLLSVSRAYLRTFLLEQGQAWREDASNDSSKYFRNRLRKLLARVPQLTGDLRELGEACQVLRQWINSKAPKLSAEFEVDQLQDVPRPLAEESARRWLVEQGVPADQIVPDVIGRLLQMAEDAASPARQHFPGQVLVSRRKGRMGKSEDLGLRT